MEYAFFIVLILASAAYARPEWDGLRVTWNLIPFMGYNAVPRETGSIGDFALRDNQCSVANATFLGQRYWHNKDPALSLLFDVNGIIAGIQTSIPKTFTPPTPLANHNYIDDGEYWTLTAYFVEPSSICKPGRSKQQLDEQGTGTGLWIQMGQDPIKDSVKIPSGEEEIKKTDWKFGKCFLTMGKHYWYNVTKEMDGSLMVPNCLLYNKGRLTAFCFTINSKLASARYEHPPTSSLNLFMDPVPDFFYNDPSYKELSTMHVFFDDLAKITSLC